MDSESEGTGAVLGVSVAADPVMSRPKPIAQSTEALPEESHSFEPSVGQSWSEEPFSSGPEQEGEVTYTRAANGQSRRDPSSEERTQNSVFMPTEPYPDGYQDAESQWLEPHLQREIRQHVGHFFLTMVGVFLALMVGQWIILTLLQLISCALHHWATGSRWTISRINWKR